MPARPAPNLAPLSGHTPAAAATRRRPPWWGVLAGLAGVLWLHGLLIEALAPARPPRAGGGGREVAVVQVRTLAAAAPVLPVATTAPAAAVPTAPVAAAAIVPPPPAAPAAAPAAQPAPPPAPPPAAPPAPPPAAAPAPADTGAPGPGAGVRAVAGVEAGAPAPVPVDADATAGDPPPVYPTRLPPPGRLRYLLRYNGQAGEATLAWRHDGQRYSLQLEGQGALRARVEQLSQGGFDAQGLAPERFTDRRPGRGWQAANFQRDRGRIGFSGPQVDYPAWPGAQDRLSWLAQFAAIQAAAVLPLPAVTLFVVDARGAGGLWRFQPQGEVLLDTPLGPLPAQHWRRDPPRPEGLRVDTWLDASRGHWPVQLRFTALRSGDVFELRLAAEPEL